MSDASSDDLLASASGVPTELPPDETAQPREHFIPLRKAELVNLLADDKELSPDERQQFLELCQLVGSTIHFQYHQKLEELKEAYFSLDPDVDALENHVLVTETVREYPGHAQRRTPLFVLNIQQSKT